MEQRQHTEDELNSLPDSTRYLSSSDYVPGLSSYSSMSAGSPSVYQPSEDSRAPRIPVSTPSSHQPPLCHFHRHLPVPPHIETLVPAQHNQYFCLYCALNLSPQAQVPDNSFTTPHSGVSASGIEPPHKYVLLLSRRASISLTPSVSMTLGIAPANMDHHHHRHHRRRRHHRQSIRWYSYESL